jgi:hypothetical protein
MRETHHFLVVTAFCIAIVPACLAQKTAADQPTYSATGVIDPNFGTSSDTVVSISSRDMQAYEPGGGVITDNGNGYRWMTAGTPKLFIGQINIPTGVTITGWSLDYCDADPAANFTATLYDFSGDNLFPTISTFIPPDRTGCGIASAPAVNHQWDLNAGHQLMAYIFQTGGSVAGSIKFRGAAVSYRRKISPAPGTATFLDVPVGSPYHRFVEALVAAGITGGCGGGNYCPDAPVTRGQMAVFLSAAVGLHWPN